MPLASADAQLVQIGWLRQGAQTRGVARPGPLARRSNRTPFPAVTASSIRVDGLDDPLSDRKGFPEYRPIVNHKTR